MKTKFIVLTFLMALIPAALLLVGCGEDEENGNPVDNGTDACADCPALAENDTVDLEYPAGGETFSVGETVTIKYRVNTDVILGAMIEVSPNLGGQWYLIPPDEEIEVPTDCEGNTACMTYSWVVGEESESVPWSEAGENTVVLRVYQYGMKANGEILGSNKFTVDPSM